MIGTASTQYISFIRTYASRRNTNNSSPVVQLLLDNLYTWLWVESNNGSHRNINNSITHSLRGERAYVNNSSQDWCY